MRRRQKWELGEVFTIPIGDGRVAVGQIVGKRHAGYWFSIHDYLCDDVEAVDMPLALAQPVVLRAASGDAKLFHGHWIVIGTAPAPSDRQLPGSSWTDMDGTVYLEDWAGTRRRIATDDEAQTVGPAVSVAPVRFEKAMRAHLGLESWTPDYDLFLPSRQVPTEVLFPSLDP